MEQVNYGNTVLEYELHYADRKSLAIEVHPDKSIHVISPVDTDLEKVNAKVIKRGRWITRQQEYFDTFLPRNPMKEFVSGESHYYVGRRYTLRIRKSKQNTVKMKPGVLSVMTTRPKDSEWIKSLLTEWYYDHAKKKFKEEVEYCSNHLAFNGKEVPQFEIRRMKNRWGSCTSAGKIILNPEIIKAPKSCLRYVIYHELCHTIIHSHSNRFYRLLDEVMPDWKKAKERLERELA